MKRNALISLAILLTFSLMFVSCLGVEGKGFSLLQKKESGPPLDIDGLSKHSVLLMAKVRGGTIALAEGVINVLFAVDKKELAEEGAMLIANAKNTKEDKYIKTLIDFINNAGEELEQCEIHKSINKSLAKKHVRNSLLYMGAGLAIDAAAVPDGQKLLSDAQTALKKISIAKAGKVKDVIKVAKFVVKEIPFQIKTLTIINNKLVEYAKTNQLSIPSQKEIDQLTADCEEG